MLTCTNHRLASHATAAILCSCLGSNDRWIAVRCRQAVSASTPAAGWISESGGNALANHLCWNPNHSSRFGSWPGSLQAVVAIRPTQRERQASRLQPAAAGRKDPSSCHRPPLGVAVRCGCLSSARIDVPLTRPLASSHRRVAGLYGDTVRSSPNPALGRVDAPDVVFAKPGDVFDLQFGIGVSRIDVPPHG